MKATIDEHGLPVPPIELAGFKTCKVRDGREVNPGQEFCAQHGGTPLSVEGVRRSVHRQIRSAINQMMKCGECEDIPLVETRCKKCAWLRGAAMGVAGVGEVMGLAEELDPLMAMIGEFDPGWQSRAFK